MRHKKCSQNGTAPISLRLMKIFLFVLILFLVGFALPRVLIRDNMEAIETTSSFPEESWLVKATVLDNPLANLYVTKIRLDSSKIIHGACLHLPQRTDNVTEDSFSYFSVIGLFGIKLSDYISKCSGHTVEKILE